MAIRTKSKVSVPAVEETVVEETVVVEETTKECEVVDSVSDTLAQMKEELAKAKAALAAISASPGEAKVAPPPVVQESRSLAKQKEADPNEPRYIIKLKNALDPDTYGNVFPRLVGSNGAIINDNLILGSFIDIQVVSYSDRWMITPVADQKDKEARKFCRASYDGKTIPDKDGGDAMLIEEYVDSQARFYKEFKTSKYLDVFGIIFNSEKNAEAGKKLGVVQISFSPTAIKPFNAFLAQCRMNVGRGYFLPTHADFMRIEAELVIGDSQNWTVLKTGFVPIDAVGAYEPVLEF
jgi:hypothetical protein